MQQQQITDFLSDIYPKKIILLKSGNYDYMPLDLTIHTGFYLANNGGKTSIINAAKMQLFNEVNFKDAGRKFGLVDKYGNFYSADGSYNYYFKSTQSFNIGEYHDSDNGDFCQIVYRGNPAELEINRLFIRCSYDKIKDIFIDEHEMPRHIDKDRMIQKMHETGFEVLHIYGSKNTRKNVGSVLYDLFGNNQGTKPFCVLPLKDPTNEASIVTAKKNIINLLAGKLSPKDIQKQLIELISAQAYSKNQEGDGGHSSAEFLSKFESANNLKQLIQDIEEREENFANLTEHYSVFKESNTDLHRTVEEVNFYLNDRLMELRDEQAQVEKEISDNAGVMSEFKVVDRDLTEKMTAAKTRKADLEKEISSLSIAIEKAKRLIDGFCQRKDIVAEYGNSDFVERTVDLLINKFKKDRETAKKGMENNDLLPQKEEEKAELIKRHAKVRSQMQAIEQQIKETRAIASSKAESMLAEMSDEDKSKLISLNSSFASLSGNDPELLSVLTEMTQHIEIQAGQIVINGVSFGRLVAGVDYEELIKEKIVELNEKRETYKRIEDDVVAINGELEVIRKVAKDYKTDNIIATYSNHIKSLQSFQVNLEKLGESEERVEELAEDLIVVEAEHEANQEKIQEIEAQIESLNKRKEDISWRIRTFSDHMQLLQAVDESLDIIPRVDSHEVIDIGDDNVDHIVKSCKSKIDRSEKAIQAFKDEITQHFVGCFTFFTNEKEDIDLAQTVYHPEELNENIDRLYEKIETRFRSLENYRSNYEDEVRVLNDAIQASLKQIRDVNHLIALAVSKINDMLSGRKISNLSAVKIDYIVSGLYESIENIASRDFISNEVENLVSEDIIMNINNAFLSNGRVDIDSLISEVKIEYSKGANKKEEQTQSNGTTAIIAIYINSLLLRDSLSKDIKKFHFPVFIDECNTIDENNIFEIVDLIKEFDFTAILAGPSEQYIAKTLVDKTIHGSYAFDVLADETLRYNRFAEEKFLSLLNESDYDISAFEDSEQPSDLQDPLETLVIPERKKSSLFEKDEA